MNSIIAIISEIILRIFSRIFKNIKYNLWRKNYDTKRNTRINNVSLPSELLEQQNSNDTNPKV
jgi:hypothetical protein